MNGNDDRVIDALRTALPPIGDEHAPRDLWPDLARRVMAPQGRAGWFDWALAAAALLAVLTLPGTLPALLYLL
jgi:anti-sigma factor RsiW